MRLLRLKTDSDVEFMYDIILNLIDDPNYGDEDSQETLKDWERQLRPRPDIFGDEK